MAVSGKGAMFSIAAIIMIAAIALTGPYIGSRYTEQANVNVQRLISMNNFIENINDDLDIALYTSSYRALVAVEDYIGTTGVYVDNASEKIATLMVDGTLYGNNSTLMINNTLNVWIDKMQIEAQKTGIAVAMTIDDVEVFHNDPWSIAIRASYTLHVDDSKGIAQYAIAEQRTSQLSIIEFTDPLSIVESSGLVPVKVNITPYEGNFEPNIAAHIQGNYFASWPGAPSYLMRLEGNMGASPFGIERLVDKFALGAQGLPIYDMASSADQAYWVNEPGYAFTVGPQFFRLDNASINGTSHIERYNLTSRVIP